VDRTADGKRIWFILRHDDNAAISSIRSGVSVAAGQGGQDVRDPDNNDPEALLDRWDDWEDDPASLAMTMEPPR
jgi:hypothetical protein